jgi:hypothetical protein
MSALAASRSHHESTAIRPAPSLRSYVSTHPVALFIVAITTFGMFLTAAIQPYAFSDDYSILLMAVSGEPSQQFGKSIFDASLDGGRPFAGLLTQGLFSLAGSIDNLHWVRLVAVMAIVVLAPSPWALVRSDVKPVLRR